MSLKPSVLANIVMDKWCNMAEQQLGGLPTCIPRTHLFHPIWSRLRLCTALDCIVVHCNTLFELQYLECN